MVITVSSDSEEENACIRGRSILWFMCVLMSTEDGQTLLDGVVKQSGGGGGGIHSGWWCIVVLAL